MTSFDLMPGIGKRGARVSPRQKVEFEVKVNSPLPQKWGCALPADSSRTSAAREILKLLRPSLVPLFLSPPKDRPWLCWTAWNLNLSSSGRVALCFPATDPSASHRHLRARTGTASPP